MLEYDTDGSMYGPGTTGRTLVLLDPARATDAASLLRNTAGISVMSSRELGDASGATDASTTGGTVFETLGVAVMHADPEQVRALGDAVPRDNAILWTEPDRLVYARGIAPLEAPWTALADHFAMPAAMATAEVPAVDESHATWGLQAVGALSSDYTGAGINVAVLDTGMDLAHPDFEGRNPQTRSFIPGEEVQDGHGHGTHCIGTACGPKTPAMLPRYGVAGGAQIYAGKVLSNRGSGSDGGILGGIEWALEAKCQVISMSLGADVNPGTPFSKVFEAVGRRCLDHGTLIVAAAGNASRRESGMVAPVGHPANCPSILAVAAIDARGAIASFSSGSDPRGGQVDIAGPGVAVYSSWPMPTRYRTISGTSMATPHVAGVAALISEATGATGVALWGTMMQIAHRLPLSSMDVGSGLVKAP